MSIRVAILISGSGSNMEALVHSMTGDHPARPVLVVSNVPGAGGLDRAVRLGVPTATVDHRAYDSREAFEAALQDVLTEARANLVCLAGFMRILTPGFVEHWPGQLLNIHPSLLPKYPGLHTHTRALEAGDTEHGATVHEVTPVLDDGPILGQTRLSIAEGDTPETLAKRLLPREHDLYTRVLRRVAEGDRTRLDLPTGEKPR